MIPPPPPCSARIGGEEGSGHRDCRSRASHAGRQFEPWGGSDWNGRPVSIHAGEAKLTLVTFWKPTKQASPVRRPGN